MAEPPSRDDLDLLIGLGDDAWGQGGRLSDNDQARLGRLGTQAATEIHRLRTTLASIAEYARRQAATAIEQGLDGQARTWRHVEAMATTPTPAADTRPHQLDPDFYARHRDTIVALAIDHGLAGVRLDRAGILLVVPALGHDRSYTRLGRFARAVADHTGVRPEVVYRSWKPDGSAATIPGDGDRDLLLERFHVGAHDGSITCRHCLSSFTLDHDTGDWEGRHYRHCPRPAP